MTRTIAPLLLPLLAACAASPAPAPVDPTAAARRAQCAEEHPLDGMAAVACESDRARLVAARSPAKRSSTHRRATGAAPAPVVLVVPSAPHAGQGLVDYGRQLAAPPVNCTSIRMGSFTSTSCR
jgi:hypothetical protein